MSTHRLVTLLFVASLAGATFVLVRADEPHSEPRSQYVTATKCKRCHSSSKIGAQYKVWLESKHAHAFLSLASDSAKVYGARKGVEDPQQSPECLKCHVTGYGEPADHFVAARADSEGVSCESCHGAGSGYWKKSTMADIASGKAEGSKFGLLLPKETCANCHNEKSPAGTFVDWPADSAKIAHPIPKGYTPEPD